MTTPAELAREILEDGFLMSLGTIDEGGVWVADIIFVPEEWELYWVSMPDARHSKALERNPKVA